MSILPRIKLAFTGLYWRYLYPQRRLILVLFFVVVGVVFIWYGGTAWAADPVKDPTSPLSIPLTPDSLLWLFSKILLSISRLFLSITIFILTFVIEIASYNGYLSSTAVSVGWVMVRDITNMGFVIILLIIAFGTILGLEQYEWKKLLVKFVMAAILVNFSRIICGVIIDIAQVVMTTFVNGVAATAGGNLINAFNLDKIQSLSQNGGQLNDSSVFLAAVGAITFSAIVMATMGVFLFMLLARMVVLWTLIVLSPLAFVLSVIPQTQKYAQEWWSEFGANVVTGPVLLFFIWLSFVTVGSGNVHDDIQKYVPESNKLNETEATAVGGSASSGVSKAMTWNSMANFAIAIGMLMVGAKAAQQLGGVGGAWAGGAIDFGKKVAMVASGVAAARWAAPRAGKLAVKGLYAATLENTVERTKMWGQRQVEGYRSWRAQGPRLQRTKLEEKQVAAGTELTAEEKARGMEIVEGHGKDHGKFFRRQGLTEEEKARGVTIKEEDDGPFKYDFERDAKGNIADSRGWLQKTLNARQEKLIKSKKILSKVSKQKEVREELMDKRVTANPEYFMQKFEGKEGVYRFDALDRMEQGQLEAEKSRSAAKTKEFGAIGRGAVLANQRFKDQKWQNLAKRGSLAAQLAQHEISAHATEAEIARLQEEEKKKFLTPGAKGGGHDLEVRTNLAEQGKKAAEDFVKGLKDKNLQGAFERAAKSIKDAIKTGTNAEKQARLETLAAQDPYIRALRASKEAGATSEAMTIQKSEAEAMSEAEYVEKGILGYSTPSSSLVPVAKRYGDALNSLTNEALGRALVDNLAFTAQKTAGGKVPLTDIQQRAGLFGTASKVNSEAYIDDAIAEMVKQIRLLESGGIADKEESAKIEALKDVWEEQLGVIERDKDGKATAYSNARNAGIVQNYAITGGDVALLKQHQAIESGMGKDEDYGVAAQRILGASFESFKSKMQENDTFTKEAASSFKTQALAAGHAQLGGHQKFDSNLGFHRMSTLDESQGIMQGEMRKRGSKVGYQYHSLGGINMTNGVLEKVDGDSYGNTIGQAKTYLEIKGIQDRTRDALMGYKPSDTRKMQEGYGLLGGEIKDIESHFKNVDNFIKDVIVPQLAKGAKAFALVAQQKFDNVDKLDAEDGKMKLQIAGTSIKADNLSSFITQIETRVGAGLSKEIKDELTAAKEAASAQGNSSKNKSRTAANESNNTD
ncbi:MAG: hypothetical protein HY983_03515 [Candidatus Magasanikbacteria bacterium]|nr:hypothetical protein [Candidatus Magasanikbacteria bacterium]